MTSPIDPQARADAATFAHTLKTLLSSPDMRNLILNQRAPGAEVFTIAETMNLVEKWADALDRSARWPISTTTTKEPDGSMTIHITPMT